MCSFTYFSTRTCTRWVVFYFLSSSRELPKCSCPWMEQSLLALKWIILYLAVICQSESHKRSRCTFWVTAISVHLGSYLLVTGRFGGGGWWRKNRGVSLSLFYLLSNCPQRKTFWVWIPNWIFFYWNVCGPVNRGKLLDWRFSTEYRKLTGFHCKPGLSHCLHFNCFKKQNFWGGKLLLLSGIICFCESRLMELSVWNQQNSLSLELNYSLWNAAESVAQGAWKGTRDLKVGQQHQRLYFLPTGEWRADGTIKISRNPVEFFKHIHPGGSSWSLI